MARIVRPMKLDPTDPGRPLVGTRANCLGVRTAGDHADIDVDASGVVVANRKGMSVTADWRMLPSHLIPEELDDGRNGARGRGMAVFVHGTGPFAEGRVADGLKLWLKPNATAAGNVGPSTAVPLDRFLADLAATRGEWSLDAS